MLMATWDCGSRATYGPQSAVEAVERISALASAGIAPGSLSYIGAAGSAGGFDTITSGLSVAVGNSASPSSALA